MTKSPLPLCCNKDHIKQLLLNMTQNAVQASSPKEVVTVSLNRSKHHMIISIIDNGSGIPKDFQKDLFEPFITTKEEGTGLGLVVCKQIVDFYGGTIDVQSEVNEGTVFTITFPVDKTDEEKQIVGKLIH